MDRGRGHKTAFVIELAALFMALVLVTLVFTGVFAMCRSRSDKAAMLNESVLLAVNAAEMASASPDMETLRDSLSSSGNAAGGPAGYETGEDASSGCVWILASPGESSGRRYVVRVTRKSEKDSSYAADVIDVFDAKGAKDAGDIDAGSLTDPVYTLETGSRHGKEAAS